MLATEDIPALLISQIRSFPDVVMDLLALNKVFSSVFFSLALLDERTCIFFTINYDVNELTLQDLIEKVWRHFLSILSPMIDLQSR